MKTPNTLLTTVFFLLAFSLQAQLTIGIKGSFVRTNLNTAPDLSYIGYHDNRQTINGYGTTVSMYFRMAKYLHIGIEPGLVRRGSRTTEYMVTGDNPFDCWDFELNNFETDCAVESYGDTIMYASYVQVPILLKGIVPLCKDRLAVFVKAGGGFSWLAAAQQERNLQLFGPSFQSSTIDLKETTYIKRWDRAWQIGAGVDLKLGPGFILIETLYFHGTQDIYVYTESRSRSFSYSLGYQINI